MSNTNDHLEEVHEEQTDTNAAESTSLDDMMAESVNDTDSTESQADDAPSQEEEKTGEADEIQDSEDSPKEETEVVDPPPSEVVEETVSEMIEEEGKIEKEAPKVAMPAPKQYRGKWYIVHTYSGHENKVAKTLMQRVQAMGFEERIFDALVPTKDTIRVRGGKKETIKEKIFPGYILVNMDLSDEAWVLVRTTPGVTSFVGAQNKPTPIRDDEVQAIVAFVDQKEPTYKAQFSMGEAVKITDGPFSDFLGTVESIDEAKGKVKVLVSIFGRETPVELDFLQVAKI